MTAGPDILLERVRAATTDEYEIERELGYGGMATVFLARDLALERRVAIKVMRPDLIDVHGIEDDQHFRGESLGYRFARLTRNGFGNL